MTRITDSHIDEIEISIKIKFISSKDYPWWPHSRLIVIEGRSYMYGIDDFDDNRSLMNSFLKESIFKLTRPQIYEQLGIEEVK